MATDMIYFVEAQSFPHTSPNQLLAHLMVVIWLVLVEYFSVKAVS